MHFITPLKIFISVIFLQSCMLKSKMNKIVTKHYASSQAITTLDNRNAVAFNTDSLTKIEGFCVTKYSGFYTVPLIFYIYSYEEITCNVNSKYYVFATINELNNLIENDVNKYKLEGKSLELIFKRMPNTLIHKYTANTFAFKFLFMGTILNEKMYYENDVIVVDYLIRNKSTRELLKRGTINEPLTSVNDKKALIDTREYFVETFLNSYDRAMRYASYSVAQKVINQL